jgi:hypothetical protein
MTSVEGTVIERARRDRAIYKNYDNWDFLWALVKECFSIARILFGPNETYEHLLKVSSIGINWLDVMYTD